VEEHVQEPDDLRHSGIAAAHSSDGETPATSSLLLGVGIVCCCIDQMPMKKTIMNETCLRWKCIICQDGSE
jgi:hypothetical protein